MLAHLWRKRDSIPNCFNIEYQRPMSCPTRPFDQNWCMESRYRHSSDTQSDREGDVSIPFTTVDKDQPNSFSAFCKAFFPRASARRVLPIVGVCISSSHLHTFTSSHLLLFTPSPLHTFPHTFSSSHPLSDLLIFTSAHLHIFSSSHLLIFTSSHLHIFSSSHLLIFTSAHLHIFSHIFSHICSSSHLLIFTSSLTSAHLHIFSHICSSSHLLFTSAHLHIFSHICSSSHLLIFTSSLLSLSLFFLSLGRGWCRRGVTKREPFRTK